MKVTVVPAQVTTVEDRIIGSLGFSQVLLLVIPIFVSAALFAILPPAMSSSAYKYVLMGIIAAFCCTLAIRIRGKILGNWIIAILRYNLRPQYYLFNKNVTTYRQEYTSRQPKSDEGVVTTQARERAPKLDIPTTAGILAKIENPSARLRFETTKKGGINVRLAEIEK